MAVRTLDRSKFCRLIFTLVLRIAVSGIKLRYISTLFRFKRQYVYTLTSVSDLRAILFYLKRFQSKFTLIRYRTDITVNFFENCSIFQRGVVLRIMSQNQMLLTHVVIVPLSLELLWL
jgi:hypothetical protein